MADPINEIRATDPDPFDDVLHFISKFPAPIPASRTWDGKEYVWEDYMDINPTTGLITVSVLPDLRDTTDQTFTFEVSASDGLNTIYEEATFLVKNVPQKPKWLVDFNPDVFENDTTINNSQITAYDRDGRTITYTVQGGVALPGTITMDASGKLSGRAPYNPGNANTVFEFYVIASTFDPVTTDILLSEPKLVRLTIKDVNRKPVWVTPAIHSPNVGPFTLQLEANDPDGTPILKYEIVAGAPRNFVINGNVLTWTGGFPDETATYQTVIGAFDTHLPGGHTQQVFTFNVSEIPNLPPVWETNGSLFSGSPGAAVNVTVKATDPEQAAVTYTMSGDVPAGLTLGATTGNLSGTISPSAPARVYNFTINASDGENVVPRVFSISLSQVNLPPEWNTPPGLLLDVYAGETIDVQLSATDPEGAALTYTISNKPAWLTMTSTGRLGGTISPSAPEESTSFTVSVSDGTHSVDRTFNAKVSRLEPRTVQYVASTDFLVPRGCFSIMFIWAVGGGGGGGGGHQYGNGGGGGGGGSGGNRRHTPIAVAPGDVLRIEVGGAGQGDNYLGSGDRRSGTAGNGGDTIIYKNGVAVLTVSGGGGGSINTNYNQGFIVAPGGLPGNPNGIAGENGPAGNSDRASTNGGAGAHGPLIGAQGGAGGGNGGGAFQNGSSTGLPGAGHGSGGGGGGMRDRNGNGYWWGGNGIGGFVEMTYPSQGVVTDTNSPHYGTPPWAETPVNTDNYISFFGPQAGSSRQANFAVNTPSMNWNIGSGGGQISSVAVFGSGIWEIWSGENYTGTKVLVDGAVQEFNINSFQGMSNVRSAKRQGS